MKKVFVAIVLSLSSIVALAAPIPLTGATVDTYFAPNGGAAKAASTFIDGAKSRVLVAGRGCADITVAAALKRAQERGVHVQVVLDQSSETPRYNGATYLANAGVEVRVDDRYPVMDHKFIIVDRDVALGSMNFTGAGVDKNAGNFNIFRGAPALTEEYVTEWRHLYSESKPYARR